jgi:hypothetical protein
MLEHAYTFRRSATVSTAITVLQIKASATRPFVILRAWASQGSSTTSAQAAIELVRKSGAATVTAAITADIVLLDTNDAATGVQLGTAATGYTATVEGTDGDVLIEEGFNVLNGWLYVPVPEERILVPAAGIIALKFSIAPPSATWKYGITYAEV